MSNNKISTSDLKEYSLTYLQEQQTDKYDTTLSINNWAKLSLKKLKDLTISETLYLLKKRRGINFLTIRLVDYLVDKKFNAYTFNTNDNTEEDEQKEIIRELLLVSDHHWQENPILYDKFKNFIKDQKHWISNILVPDYVFDHFLNMELKEIIWTDENTKRLQEWIDLDNASGYGTVVERVLHIRRALDNGVKIIYNSEQEIKDFDTFVDLAVEKLTAADYILREVKNEIRIKN